MREKLRELLGTAEGPSAKGKLPRYNFPKKSEVQSREDLRTKLRAVTSEVTRKYSLKEDEVEKQAYLMMKAARRRFHISAISSDSRDVRSLF